jgi:pyridoxamine 5'-phosphate oxidase-like protein
MCWADFEAAAPDMAAVARSVIERRGFVYAGTVRRDGAPRISPVEAHFVRGRLMLVMIAGSRKAQDLARDPRLTLQSPVAGAGDPGVEVKVRGRATEVDEQQRAATADAVEAHSGWRPQPSWRVVAVAVEAVAVLAWEQGEMVLGRWDRRAGLRPQTRLRLDAEASAYR